jgi:hypothetical protein
VYVVRNTKAVRAARDAANQALSKRGKPVGWFSSFLVVMSVVIIS